MQDANEIEAFYAKEDPWSYKTNPDDIRRKEAIVRVAKGFGPYTKVLDLGAGEGWITEALPGDVLHGYELSTNAARRFPAKVQRVAIPDPSYDLVAACGIMYHHYDLATFMHFIKSRANKHVLVSSIMDWEANVVNAIGKEIHRETFPYREYDQVLRVFEVTNVSAP